jgi:hypothetical protein
MPPKKAGKKGVQLPPAFDAADVDDHEDLQAIITADSGCEKCCPSCLPFLMLQQLDLVFVLSVFAVSAPPHICSCDQVKK